MAFDRQAIPIATEVETTLVQCLRHHAQAHPQRNAYTFILDGDMGEVRISYAELDQKARTIAAMLQERGLAGQRALLLYPPGLDYIAGFFGCLYAGVVAVPAYPPNPVRLERTLPRLRALVADAQAAVALTISPILALASFIFTQAPDLAGMEWLATDTPELMEMAERWREPNLTLADIAFLQYTSGSTRAPRGVVLSHGNLMHNLAVISESFGLRPGDSGVIWLPPYHDMGLIGGILEPTYHGFSCTLMSPLTFLQRPFRWLEAISRTRATVSGGPNFAYDLCVRKITPEQRATLDLSCLEVAFTGAEAVHAATLDRFAKTFAAAGFRRSAFYPCYGLAEATLIASGGERNTAPVTLTLDRAALERHRVTPVPRADGQTLVGCGCTLRDQEIRIVDPETSQPAPPDRVGEIWMRGPSVAQGYWQNPTETNDTFHGYLSMPGDGLKPDGPYLRSGDLGFMYDGELYITGRRKDLIIIDGLNHYPQDIERTVEELDPLIRPGCSAAFSVETDDGEKLVVVVELAKGAGSETDLTELKRRIIRAIADTHELRTRDVVFLKSGDMFKTSSGKVQRHACKEAYLAGTLDALNVKRNE